MNLYRLLLATILVFPVETQETELQYQRRILLCAARALEAMELFKRCGENQVGSEPKISDILKKYHEITTIVKGKKS